MNKKRKRKKTKMKKKLRLIGAVIVQESAIRAELQAKIDRLVTEAMDARRKASGLFGHFQEIL